MAQYQVTHTCGHSETVQITGTDVHGERARRAAWLESLPCLDCQHEAQRAQAAAETADMPALTGSPRQVAWATTIRASIMREIAEQQTRQDETGQPTPPNIAAAIARLRATTAAGWWIDHRDGYGTAMRAVMS